MRSTSLSTTARRVAALSTCLGALLLGGCATDWAQQREMGAGPAGDRTQYPPKGKAGPGTVMPSGTQAPSR